LIREFLAKHLIPVLPQPPSLPDLSNPDPFLFPTTKITLKGKLFQTPKDTIMNMTDELE
jgi:hypothetical protein